MSVYENLKKDYKNFKKEIKGIKKSIDEKSNEFADYSSNKVKNFFGIIKKNAKAIGGLVDEKSKEAAAPISKKIQNRLDKNHSSNIDEEALEKDILFSSEKIKEANAEKKKAVEDEKRQKDEENKKKAKFISNEYLISVAQEKLEELKKAKKDLEKKLNEEKDDPKKKEIEEELKSYTQEEMGKTVTDEVLDKAQEKAKWLKENDTEQHEEGYDYVKIALKQAKAGIAGDDEASKKAKDIIEKAEQAHNTKLYSEMGVLEGIKQELEKRNKQRQELVGAAEESGKKLIEDYMNEEDVKIIAPIALERAKKKADYLRANNDPEYKGKKDNIFIILNTAKNEIKSDDPEKEKIEKIITEAKKRHSAEKEAESKRQQEMKTAEEKEYDMGAQVNIALAELDQKKKELEEAKQEYSTDPGMAAYYDEEIKKIDAERAKTALNTRMAVKAKLKEREEAKKKESEKKQQIPQEATDAQKAIEEAQKKLKEQQEQQAKNAQSTPKVNQPNGSSSEASDKKSGTEEEKILNEFLDTINPESDGTDMQTNDDDDYDFDDYDEDVLSLSAEDQKQKIEKRKRIQNENFEKSKRAMKNLNRIDDMYDIIVADINYIRSKIKDIADSQRVDGEHRDIVTFIKDRKDTKNQSRVIERLQSEIDSHFETHATHIKRLEELKDKGGANINYVIEMSSLLDEIYTSLNDAQIDLEGSETISDDIETMKENLHAPLFKKLGKSYLLNQKITITDQYGETIKDENGEDKQFSAFKQAGGRRRTSSWNITRSSSITGGTCYMAMLRTIINICNAQTHLSTKAPSLVSSILEKCKTAYNTGGQNKQLTDRQIQEAITQLLGYHWESNEIRSLMSDGAGTSACTNAEKLNDMLELLKKLQKNPSDPKTIEKIKDDIEDFNEFDDLGMGGPEWTTNYTNTLYLVGNYQFFPPKK